MSVATERKFLEMTYDALCTISNSTPKKVNGETTTKNIIVVENQPCALSQVSNKFASQTETKANTSYTAKLFVAPELEILPGSKITVTQYGAVYTLKQTGIPIKYPTHQEIVLTQEGIA